MPLEQKIRCQSRKEIFNPEIERQWWQNQNEISAEDFVHSFNSIYDLRNPAKTMSSDSHQGHFDGNYQDLTDIEDLTEDEVD